MATGSCLCGKVAYQTIGELKLFQYCHCSRCRKATGSAHASNIYVKPDKFEWLAGESYVKQYALPDTKYFGNAFCTECGSTLPWLNQTGTMVIVPAGTLDDDPEIRPVRNIFCNSKAVWYVDAKDIDHEETIPKKKN